MASLSSSPVASVRPTPEASSALEAERSTLWGLCYRMTGSAPDADDLVQETFVRAMERPPEDTSMPWRPWLVRVAMNLARDHLRGRKRRAYHGLWLPTPVETPVSNDPSPFDVTRAEDSPEARYGAIESASFAFLVAVEALTPAQRAVLILRDAFDYSSRETADALGLTEENVRITLHRARKAMAAYDGRRAPPNADESAKVEAMLRQMLTFIATQDLVGAASVLATNARSLGDGGGVYHAARGPVVGAEKIVKLYGKLSTKTGPDAKFEIRRINGVPALVGEDPAPSRPNAPRVVLFIDLDRDGKVAELYSVIAPEKLGRVAWSGRARDSFPPGDSAVRPYARPQHVRTLRER